MKKTLQIFFMLLLVVGATDFAWAQKINEVKKCKTCGDAIAACPFKGNHPKPVKKCKTCAKPVDQCPYGGKHPAKCETCGKMVDKCPYKGKHPVAPSGYDVTITSNPGSDATLYIDGTNYGNSSGTHYMKAGSHNVTFTAEGYENINKTINVDKNNTWFSFTMTEKSADALYQLGDNYLKGASGFDEDLAKAAKWFRKSADKGYAQAQNKMGQCYYYGEGVDQSYTEAVKWYRKAADQDNPQAQYNLGDCYYYGKGVKQDYTEAVKWFRKSADQGNDLAQYNLGFCYAYGYGVVKDITEAKKWYHKAADQGNEKAKSALKSLDNHTTKIVRKF